MLRYIAMLLLLSECFAGGQLVQSLENREQKSIENKPTKEIRCQVSGSLKEDHRRLWCCLSDYTDLDIIPFWGDIQTPALRRRRISLHQGHLYSCHVRL